METTLKLQTLPYRSTRTYAVAAIFAAGNIILPQIAHLIPQGGTTWLPIYFFTLIGAYKYGWKAGLVTALLSPMANSLLFGMPAASALATITAKSTLLALAAGYAAHKYKRATLPLIAAVVIAYQAAGTLCEWIITADLALAAKDLTRGWPGMMLQTFAGYALIKYLTRNN